MPLSPEQRLMQRMVLFQSAHHTGGGLELCCSPQFPFPACSPHALAWSCWSTSFINPLYLPYCLQLPRGACPICMYSFKQMHRMRFCPQGGWFITGNTPVLEPIEHGDRVDWDFPTEASGSFLGFYTWPLLSSLFLFAHLLPLLFSVQTAKAPVHISAEIRFAFLATIYLLSIPYSLSFMFSRHLSYHKCITFYY